MKGPHIDWAAISPLVALTAGACIVLMAGLLRPSFVRTGLVPGLTIVTLGVAAGLGVWQWDENTEVIARALAVDDLTLALLMIFVVGGVAATLLSVRALAAAEAGHGEYHALILVSVLGMVVLAALFLIVALATLAMPGSANFVGEFLILLGLFQTKLAIAIIAFTGVAMASVYMLRMFIRTMHNRQREGVESREIALSDAMVIVPLVLVILGFALYPQAALNASEASVDRAVRQVVR